MITATRTTQEAVSNQRRNQNPIAVTAKSLAKFAAASAPVSTSRTARAANEAPTRKSPRAFHHGSTSQTSPKAAGIRQQARKATSHEVDAVHHDSDVA